MAADKSHDRNASLDLAAATTRARAKRERDMDSLKRDQARHTQDLEAIDEAVASFLGAMNSAGDPGVKWFRRRPDAYRSLGDRLRGDVPPRFARGWSLGLVAGDAPGSHHETVVLLRDGTLWTYSYASKKAGTKGGLMEPRTPARYSADAVVERLAAILAEHQVSP
jgi:hypothetical protein